MAAKLTFEYDGVGDILYVGKCPPYKEQESEDIGDEVVARLNPQTGEVENLEILFFAARLQRGESIVVPVIANLRVAD